MHGAKNHLHQNSYLIFIILYLKKLRAYTYTALFPKLIGKADLSLLANYDIIRWIRFWGLGNETQFVPDDVNYFTARSEQWIFKPGIIRNFGFNKITFSPFIQGVRIRNDTNRFVGKNLLQHQMFLNGKHLPVQN